MVTTQKLFDKIASLCSQWERDRGNKEILGVCVDPNDGNVYQWDGEKLSPSKNVKVKLHDREEEPQALMTQEILLEPREEK